MQAPSPDVRLLGIALAEPQKAVVGRYGEVGGRWRDAATGEVSAMLYVLPENRGAVIVHYDDNRVKSITVAPSPFSGEPPAQFTDPFGVGFTATQAQLRRLRGVPNKTLEESSSSEDVYTDAGGDSWSYRFAQGRLLSIAVSTKAASLDRLPPVEPALFHRGDSAADALIDRGADEASGNADEEAYRFTSHCGDGTGRWNERLQELAEEHGRTFDVLKWVCATRPKQRRTVYIDISAFFGKLGG